MGPYRHSLNMISVPEPCVERWDRMEGDATSRFCRVCQNHVYDLSQLTLPEASGLIALTNGKPCVRLYRRADGTFVTKEDCRIDRARARRRRWSQRAALAAAVGLMIGVAAGATAATLVPLPRPYAVTASDGAAKRPAIRQGWVTGRVEVSPRADPVWIDSSSLSERDAVIH